MAKAEFIANQIDGKFTIKHRQSYLKYQKALKNGAYKIRITRLYPPKTNPQLGYYYTAVVETVMDDLILQNGGEYVEFLIGGVRFQHKIDKGFVDAYIKKHCARVADNGDLCIAVEGDTRKVLNKANMSKRHAMQLLDNAIKWAANELHIVIPEPEIK